ncbi:hypothetical protein BOO91_21150 [Vibrio navarrensis]|nr:hypothetical protein UF06_15930 [Vibrio sp. S234-5]MBE3663418.1 hypothetical protein [Vibrio navarrensis]MBE4605985.1 hypothetical protein [Vibrio navarrensis]
MLEKQRKRAIAITEIRSFCLYKAQHISPKAVGMLKAKCKTVLDLVGKSHLPLIRRRDAEDAMQLLRHYPVNMKKHPQFKGLTAKEAVKLNTCYAHFSFVTSFFGVLSLGC